MSSSSGPKLKVVVCGGGPVALNFATRLAEYMKDSVEITMFENRWKPDGKGGMTWRTLADNNRRRPQVVTVQDDVSALLSKRTEQKFFEQQNERVWPTSRNIAIREVEDRMLERIQEPDVKPYVKLVNEIVNEEKLKSLNGTFDVMVGCDGGRSFVRDHFAIDFQPQQVGGDYGLGIAFTLPPGMQPQPQSMNICLTVSQTRYLLNSREGRTGFLNMRLDESEWNQICDLKGEPCPWHRPGLIRKSNGELGEAGAPADQQFKPQADNSPAWLSILEGLKLFKIPVDTVEGIIRIPIDVIYSGHFVAEMRGYMNSARTNPPIAFVAGDAAFRVHFWPGRGLNSGIKAAVSLARGIYWAYTNSPQRVLRQQDFWRYEAFMQGLRYREEEGRSMPVVEMRQEGKIVTIGQRIAQARESWWAGTNYYEEFVKTMEGLMETLERNPAWPQPKSTLNIRKYLESTDVDPLTYNILHCSGTWPRSAMAGEEISPSILFPNPSAQKSTFPTKAALAEADKKLGGAIATALKTGAASADEVAKEIANGEMQNPVAYPAPGAMKEAGTRGPSLPSAGATRPSSGAPKEAAPAPAQPAAAPAARPSSGAPAPAPKAAPAGGAPVLAIQRPAVVGGRQTPQTAFQSLPVPAQPDQGRRTPSPRGEAADDDKGTRQKLKEKAAEKMSSLKSHLKK